MTAGSNDNWQTDSPEYCEYAGGACEDSFEDIAQREALVLYPSQPLGFLGGNMHISFYTYCENSSLE